jgi:PAS domain S-box-containing protein
MLDPMATEPTSTFRYPATTDGSDERRLHEALRDSETRLARETEAREAAEAALRQSDERHAIAMRAINESVFDWDIEKKEVAYSTQFHAAALMGVPDDEMRNPENWYRRIHPDDLPGYNTSLAALFRGNAPRFDCTYRYRAGDGSWRWARQHGLALRDAEGRARRMIGAIGDVTEQKETAAALDQARSRLDEAIEAVAEGFVLFDAADRLVLCNSKFRQIFTELGRVDIAAGVTSEELLRGACEHGMFPEAGADPGSWIARILQHGRDPAGPRELLLADGRCLQVNERRTADGGLVGVYADITDMKQREAQLGELVDRLAAARDAAEAAYGDLKTAQASLIQAEKMASLGQLTAGIAHEIKNPLNFVNNFANLSVELLDELKETTASAVAALGEDKRTEINETILMLTGNLEKIAEHGRRADNIVTSMLEHSRGVTGERREVDLNRLVDEALNLAYHGARAQDQGFNITLEREFDEAIAPIALAPQEITRVFLNLFGNGFYAAVKRQRDGAAAGFRPLLKVSTRDVGEAVEIKVRDNGIGIPPGIKDRLFQPFFTTKPTGQGTGLGLSISYDIVTQQHGGTITVDSEPGAFTEFTVRLPRGRVAAS